MVLLILITVAMVLTVVALVQSNGRNWLAWAVLLLCLAHWLPFMGTVR